MGFDLHLVPPEPFLQWDERQWEAYWKSDLAAASEWLGHSTSVGLAIEAVTHNPESDRPGSRFPLLMRLHDADPAGWHHDEAPRLLAEIVAVRDALASLPLEDSTPDREDGNEVRRPFEEFERRNGRRPSSVYDLHRHFFDT